MASEYLKWKARNEKPAPPPPPMTKKEKRLNWLHYHKLHLIVGNESNDVLSLSGLWYFTWTSGEGREITNAAGEEATAYSAQIYLLVVERGSGADAENDIADWMAREAQSYETGESSERSIGEQRYHISPLLSTGESNPYSHGAAAFAARGNLAISVELLCSEDFESDAQTVLEQFLSGFHYGD